MRIRLLCLTPVAILAGVLGCFRATPPGAPKRVKLVVVVVFDQMRGDYVEKWRPLFGPGGFRRLQSEGVWFANCNYPYSTTETGPGHASILSGCSAEKHGIISNEWYDRSGEDVYCATTKRYSLVPAKHAKEIKPGDRKPKSPVAGDPDRLLSPTVAETLREASGGKSKIFGLSLKDRSAILPLGHSGGEAYWFDGSFRTSTFYRDTLPGWVRDFNASGVAESYFGQKWERLREPGVYQHFAGADSIDGEGKGVSQFLTFPHPTDGGSKTLTADYYDALANSPFGNQLLLEFTKTCISAENLGKDDSPDLLVVSFSSNDLIGHTWGPDSQEVLDVTLRSDALMAEFLGFLDTRIGRGNYAMIVTADHGVCPLPEVEEKKGREAKRVQTGAIIARAEDHLRTVLGAKPLTPGGSTPQYIERVMLPSIYLNQRLLAARKLDPNHAADVLANWLQTQDGIAKAYTRQQLTGPIPDSDEIGRKVKKSFFPARSGDVFVVLKPYHLDGKYGNAGTGHGSPYPYDTHVPLLVYGPGLLGGRRSEPVTPQHAAPTAALYLGVPTPRDCDYTLPRTLTTP